MKRKFFLLILVPLILSLMTSSVYGSTETVTPSHDAYVDQGAPGVNWNVDWLYVRNHPSIGCRSWLKFSVPSTPFGMEIESARVYLYLYSLAFPNLTAITIHHSEDDSWTETTITWNNQPSYQAMLDNQTVYTTGTWYSWNVTGAVSSGQIESFVLIASTYYPSAKFCSKEYDGGSLSPYLQITYGADEESISIMNLPVVLGQHLGISTFAAGLLLSTMMTFGLLLAVAILNKGVLLTLIVSLGAWGFFIAISWLPAWMLIVVGLLLVVMYGTRIKKAL